MKCLNEFIARAASKEDNCNGKFWEGRFKSQALLDDIAMLSCMAYVDLNPIRAGMSRSLSTSEFTSIQERIIQHNAHHKLANKKQANGEISVPEQPPSLLPFAGHHNTNDIPFSLADYLELADWSGRYIYPKKAGFIDSAEPKILAELGIEEGIWLEGIQIFRRHYGALPVANLDLGTGEVTNNLSPFSVTPASSSNGKCGLTGKIALRNCEQF